MKKSILFAIVISEIMIFSPAFASDGRENIIYAGAGTSIQGNSVDASDSVPFSVGYLRVSNTKKVVWGFDVSQEGTKLDSTWGQSGAVKQGTSINALIGAKLAGNARTRLDASALVGVRQKTTECPASYLGYRCYANQEPTVSYAFNYGGVVTLSFARVMVGARVTGESAQGLLGFRF